MRTRFPEGNDEDGFDVRYLPISSDGGVRVQQLTT